MDRTLWLVGMMGSGKTSVAPVAAALLEAEWADTDDLVEHLSGRRLSDLVAESPEVFRDLESEVVTEVAGEGLVVACGGGVVTRPDNVRVMRESGFVIWMSAGLATLAGRVGDGAGRPLLGTDPGEALSRLLSERSALYGAAADAVVETDGRTVEEVAAEVVEAWNASSGE